MTSIAGPWLWSIFGVLVLGMLALDLGVFHRKAHVIRLREAAVWSAIWVGLALSFNVLVLWRFGMQRGLEFFQAWLVEKALSVDNIFVFLAIFSYFAVAPQLQHRVLFWGILGALIMRGAMIAAGAALFSRFAWVTYVFGAFLVITGIRMGAGGEKHVDPGKNPVLKLVRRIIPVHNDYHGQKFFVRATDEHGVTRRMATPLFVVLVLIETMDLVFAVDSIPAVFAVTREPFLVYTSNVAAILGLRSLYFLLAGAVTKLRYLSIGLAAILIFVGLKMLSSHWFEVPTVASLGVIVLILATAAAASIYVDRKEAV